MLTKFGRKALRVVPAQRSLTPALRATFLFKSGFYAQPMQTNFFAFNTLRNFSISDKIGDGGILEMETNEDWGAVLESEIPVILETGADWCGPCKMFKPMMVAAAKDYPKVQLVYMDIDKFKELAQMMEI